MSRDDDAAEIVGRCRERLERGDTVDPEAVIREHPELAATLRDRFAALALLDRTFPVPRSAPSHAGRAFGPYRLVEQIGAGGMGTVYLATVERATAGIESGARVAVKIVHPHLVASGAHAARFTREAELGRRVRHDNVVRTLDVGEATDGGAPVRFLVMEYVQGRTLRALLDESGRLPEELCRHIGREIAKALAAIHREGAVHRDLKPENVMICRMADRDEAERRNTPPKGGDEFEGNVHVQHVVKVMDLGVARLVDETARLSQTGAFVGSLHYAAPEQFGFRRSPVRAKGDEVDGRADLHALGLVLYELATGTHPFADDDFRVVARRLLEETPPRCGASNPQLSAFLEELVAQLLQKDREKRPADADAVARILEQGEESAWWRERAASLRRETRRPLRRIRIPRETALYGRETELALLRSLFERASKGEGQLALIEGEAGIGKSRLVDEFVGALAQASEDVNFLFGSYPPGGAATASGAFSTAYREHLGDDDNAVREALAQTPLLAPAFAALLRGDVAPEQAEKLTKDSLQTVFVHATRSFAATRTTIVFIDDLHFAPEEGRGLFASLALAVPGHRILLIGGARPSLDEKWVGSLSGLPHLTRLPVPRLSAQDLVALLLDALKSQHLAEELAGKIAAKSDGNPFFVFEILRTLRDGKFLTRRDDGTWITTKEIREIEVPPSVAEVVQARIGGLAVEDRHVLDVAACVGFEFDAALVGDVLDVAPIPLLQRLGQIEKRHRLVRSVGRRFAFDHHQVQEVLYAALSESQREAHHAAIAKALERRSGAASKEPKDLDGSLCVDLAEHFLKGGQGPRALRYLDAGLTHLEGSYLNGAAARLADHALAEPELLLGCERVDLLLRGSARLDLLGRRDNELKTLEEAQRLADATGDPLRRARTRTLHGACLSRTSNDASGKVLAEAIVIARDSGELRQEADARVTLGIVLQNLGRFDEARSECERSLWLSRAAGDRHGEARATGNLGTVLKNRGHFDEAASQAEQALRISRDIGDRRLELQAATNLGITAYESGRLGVARQFLAQALALAREIGDRLGEARAIGNLGSVCTDEGRGAEARDCFERHLTLSREIGYRRGELIARTNLGWLRSLLGDLDGAQRDLGASLAVSRAIGDPYSEAYILHSLAYVAADRGDPAEAEELWRAALELRREIGARSGEATTLLAHGAHLARETRLEEAHCEIEAACAIAHELSLARIELEARAWLAWLPGGDAKSALAVLSAQERRLSTESAIQVRLLLWQATHDLSHLVEATRLLDHLVAHAPPECREPMVANVRLHREIAAAAREHGIA